MDLSIIVPVYNVENYVKECIYSIKNLKGIEYEIITINDGSTDGSLDILLSLQEEIGDKLIIINQNNSGLSIARNVGLTVSRGRFISFIDSDDFVLTEEYQKVINEVIVNYSQVDIVFFDFYYFQQGKLYQDNIIYRRKKKNKMEIMEGKKFCDYYFDNKYKNFRVEACFQIVRKEFIVDNELFFAPGIVFEDTLYTFKNLLYANAVTYLNNNAYVYRMRDNSITHLKDEENDFKKINSKKYIIEGLINVQNELNKQCKSINSYLIELLFNLYMIKKDESSIIKKIDLRSTRISIKILIKYFILMLNEVRRK